MKKMKLTLVMLLAFSMVLAACGGKSSEEGSGSSDAASGDVKTVKIFQFKTEIVDGLNELKVEFEKEHPNIKLDIQTVGGGADYGASLKTKFASGDAPDIFSNGGYAEMEMWFDNLEDLSDQPWVADLVDMAKKPMTKDGKVYGMPMNLEGWGYIYNKDLFEQAGITELPKTYSQLEDAAKKLEAIGVTPFANAYQEWWLLGNQGINPAFALQNDPDAFIKGLSDGTEKFAGNPLFEEWAKLMQLTLDHGNKNPLTTDYNTAVSLLATEKAAMMQNGNWSQTEIDAINPDLNLGFLPMPMGEDAEQNDKLNVGVPANLVINKNSPVKEEAKVFLNWLVTSDIGKEYIVKKFKFIPALSTIEATPEDMGDLGASVWEYVQAGKVLPQQAPKFPDGVTQEFANSMQAYFAGKSDVTKMLEDMQASWDSLSQ
ncbi:ABC transporter substrate-binding protein [Paenibacillus sp. FSL K6-1566]|uniref:Raffinose/stachyose/melibiose transport system substrate-binding protein n=1 Tax=Paenibacillus lactis TaxID=228574 RepID=A0ABS4FKS4_9BACL|nr:ABC transporter substrate-binding protein [Paenibacillus lactis]MBP1896844.1 raffinose/stachyose/melibiose transport system substrate-binding protein [Paenibacillus lactis]HAF98000.1 ABC transporter substrate-binding protein [Paenibacillus lactis]